MASSASTVRVTFLGDASSLNRAANQARGEIDKVGKTVGGMKKLVGGLAVAGAGAAAFGFAKGLVADAEESAKVMRLTDAVIKSTGMSANIAAGAVADLATEISNKTGVDDEAIQSGQNLLLTFTNIKNQGPDKIFNQASMAITDMTAALNNGDVSAEKIKGSSIMLGKALNDPIKGITALTRSGVSFTDQQKKQIEQMVKAGDTAGAQKIILKELNKEFGGAAAAASSPAQKAQVAWGNLREQLGSYLLPVVSKVATFLSTKVIPAVSKFAENIRSGGGGFARFREIVGKVRDFIANQLVPALKRFGDWFTTVGWPAIKRFGDAFMRNVKPAVDSAIRAFNEQLRPALAQLIEKFQQAWPTIQRVLTILGKIAGFIVSRVVPVLIQLYAKYLATVIRVFGQVFAAGWKVIGFLIDLGKKVGQAGAAFGRFVGKISGAMADAYNAVKRGVGNAVSFIGGLPGKAVNAIGNLGKTLWNVGIDLIQGFIDGIEQKARDILSAIKSSVTDKIPGWIKGPLGIDSPSKLTREYGRNLSEGMALGIKDRAKKIQEQLAGMIDKAKQKLADIKQFAADIRTAFVDSGNVAAMETSGWLSDDEAAQPILPQLQQAAARAAEFAKGIAELRKRGLNETTLGQLREAGPDSLGAVRGLLAENQIGQVNALTRQIAASGGAFAEREARARYGVGANETLATLNRREQRIVFDLHGADSDLKKLIRKWVREEAGGNVQKAFGT